ncbi:MAG: hypothetical protein CMK07_13715 [Ponticaulis sp.]|nr:hypothetical protein [Ponticaulis sp.]
MHANKNNIVLEQPPENPVDLSDQRIAQLNQETTESSLLGIITARPLFSETGDVVDFQYLTANSGLKRSHGISPEDLVGKTMLGVFPDLREHFTFPYYCEVAKTGESIVFESDFKSEELDLYVVVSVSRPDPDYITITFVEVSETVRITDALAELNVLSGTQAELDVFIRGAMEIGCRAVNAARAFQLNLRDQTYSVARQTGQDDAPVERRPLPTEVVMSLRASGRAMGIRDISKEFQLSAEAGSVQPYQSLIGAPFSVDLQNDSALVFCSASTKSREPTPSELKLVRTLAEAIAARIRLDAAMRAVQQRNEDLQRFASLVSHDLKAPLRTIRLLSEMLTDYLVEDPQAKVFIDEIQANADQAQVMIKALRNFSQLGSAGLQVEALNVGMVVNDCLSQLAADIREANAEVSVTGLGTVLADRALLFQVFSNLIVNALKYASNPDLRIWIDCEAQNDGVLLISVADNGGGVDVRYSERIFELFRRVPGSEQKIEGDGVGLATCRKIIESLGGKIWLDTDFTSGARFCLTLPEAD